MTCGHGFTAQPTGRRLLGVNCLVFRCRLEHGERLLLCPWRFQACHYRGELTVPLRPITWRCKSSAHRHSTGMRSLVVTGCEEGIPRTSAQISPRPVRLLGSGVVLSQTCSNEGSDDAFKAVGEAYEVLQDAHK